MTLTHSQIKEVAAGIVNRLLADVLFENAGVRKAVDKISPKNWQESVDEFIEETADILMTKFGVSD